MKGEYKIMKRIISEITNRIVFEINYILFVVEMKRKGFLK